LSLEELKTYPFRHYQSSYSASWAEMNVQNSNWRRQRHSTQNHHEHEV